MSPTSADHPLDAVSSTAQKDGSVYPLLPTEEERNRLYVLNVILLNALGDIQMHAPVDLSKTGAAVLESGTGPGFWLIDLAKVTPVEVELVGIDISASFFPAPETIPPNLTFKQMSIASLPTEWTNKFTLVHQRFLFAAMRFSEWVTAIGNIYNVLQPGGWFQLFEIDDWISTGPMLKSFSLSQENLVKAWGGEGLFPHGYIAWKKMMEDVGFVNIRITFPETPVGKWAGKAGEGHQQNVVTLLKGTKSDILRRGGLGIVNDAEEYDRWAAGVQKEIEEGDTKPGARWVMICAQKPVDNLREKE
ncbi:hypothetical protein NP233_g2513 [Leucocoprinus birnbaumii]|uniref:Methyltransferase domain-containing protein n=1 Tax=Leucocoprinus birnbaumii TaxID=56174 RepID=A0AAD5VY65_9AGAR|nr:hypothetical protein NP233_g2513 [Leucocoprinus birnbaumii]